MFETKKDVDKHVKTAFSKLNGSEVMYMKRFLSQNQFKVKNMSQSVTMIGYETSSVLQYYCPLS